MNKNTNITQVDKRRWQQAQTWEHAHWVNTQKLRAKFGKNYIWRLLHRFGLVEKYRGDDWNLWWKKQFDEYKFLPNHVENAIEVGCGPYTNIRHIIPTCRPDRLYLSDPLIRTYIKFKLSFTADAYRKAFCILDDFPLEQCPYRDNLFDLVVMINVLDHVQDAEKCMENLIRITKPGGFLIIGQDLSNEEDLIALDADEGLIGHPIKISGEWFAPYLSSGFNPYLHKVLNREEGRGPEHHYGTLLFAGRKLEG